MFHLILGSFLSYFHPSISPFVHSFIHQPPTPVLIHKTCERKKTARRNRGREVGSKRITGKITGMRHMASADLDTRPVAVAVGQLITSSDGAHRARFFCFHFRPFSRRLFFFAAIKFRLLFHRLRRLRRWCCFGSPSLRVHCGYFVSLSTPDLYRIAHLSLAPALFVLPSISSSYQLLVSFSGDYFPFCKYSSYRCQWCR